MSVTSKRALVALGALTLVVGAGAASIAGGQGSGGPPTGTLSFKVRITQQPNHNGINPAVPRNKKRPKVADLMAANADILSMTGQRIGRAHDVNVTTFEGARKYKGKAIGISNTVYDFFGGDFLFTECVREDSPTNNSCAVIGGTGRFAGARGSAIEDFTHGVENKKTGTFIGPVTVTFMP
jgi:hypothetical protein